MIERRINRLASGFETVFYIGCGSFDGYPMVGTADRIVKVWRPTRDQAEQVRNPS